MSLLNRSNESEIFKTGMELSLEWGENWLRPINERLRKKYPLLTEEQADALNKRCKEIQAFCWDDLCWKEADGKLTLDEVKSQMCQRFPELSEELLSRLISQGYYYARK